MNTSLPPNPSFENLKKQAKTLLKAWQIGDPDALARIRASHPQHAGKPDAHLRRAKSRLTDCQLVLARDADVLIYDAQYTPDEYCGRVGHSRMGWGHSTWEEGVRVARAADVKKLVLFHHEPSHDDAMVAEIERTAAEELPGTIAAREGLTLSLASRRARRAA